MTAVEKVKWDHVKQRVYPPHSNRANELTSQLGKKKRKKEVETLDVPPITLRDWN